MTTRRQRGGVLLTVSILLAMVAAMAFTLNREGTGASRAVDARYDAEVARYLAEAAVAQALWVNQTSGCGKASVDLVAFGAGEIRATVTDAGSKDLNIVATGSPNAGTGGATRASFTIKRDKVVIHNLAKSNNADLGGGAIDTYIAASQATIAYGSALTLALASGQNALLYWPATDLPADVRVTSATLMLRQTLPSSVARPIGVHRVLRAWDAGATWQRAQALTAWSAAGGDYSGVLASASAGSAALVSWDVTALVDGWVNGSIANNGMLLKMVNANQSATFHSLQALTAANRPVLRVTYAKPC